MSTKSQIFPNLYQDSVSLMQLSAQISKLPGIEQASVVMGTPMSLAQLRDAGLANELKAGPNDLVIAVAGTEEACDQALVIAHEHLTSKPEEDAQASEGKVQPTGLAMAREQVADLNLALISVPGDYAAAEALKALALGMNVMLFSDNVSPEQELAVKTCAREKDLLVMGPDCGTAIINGLPLGFANVVKRGAIGVVGASGTGLQEVTCRIDQLGAGISQALGTGGHDLHETIGGISMLQGLQMLADDPETRVIVLISKPPARPVAERVIAQAQRSGKPVVVHFLGADEAEQNVPGITPAGTLADAASVAVHLLTKAPLASPASELSASDITMLAEQCRGLPAGRRDIRGVFAGGTFCFESQLMCQRAGFSAASNTPVKGNHPVADLWRSAGHTLVDMGDDEYTRGRPHPMIDPTLRNQRIVTDLQDPATAVVLFDLVLGYGAAAAPADELITLLQGARKAAGASMPLLVAHVCGTEADPQVRSRQIDALRNAGVLVADCNARAAQWAAQIARTQAEK